MYCDENDFLQLFCSPLERGGVKLDFSAPTGQLIGT